MIRSAGFERSAVVLKGLVLVALAAGLCPGVTCTIDIPGDGGGSGDGPYVPLDEAHAVITITQAGDSAVADVQARITRFGLTVRLQRGQVVSVNGMELIGPEGGVYRRSVPAASTYAISVNEPTRGVLVTTIGSPGGFAITSPTAGQPVSLAGFITTWSNPDPALTASVVLTQTLFGDVTTREFGPFPDAGTQSFSAADLAQFKQGADLVIAVTRINRLGAIPGFKTGTLSVIHSRTVSAAPVP